MSQAKLILSQTPALSVPLRFFFTAPLFGIAAAALLLLQGDIAFSSRWSPGLLAGTHLLVLGYLAMVMQGALLQIVSVLTGGRPPHAGTLGTLIHASLTIGTLLLAGGLLIASTPLLHGAAALLGINFMVFIGTITAGLLGSSTRRDAGTGIGLSLACLGITVGLGIWLALGHGSDEITLARNLTDTHLGWGLIGWGGILLITVAYEVVPMFQLTPVYPGWLTRSLAWAVLSGLSLWTGGEVSGNSALSLAGGLLVALSLTAFALTTLRLQWQRKKKQPEATVWFWRLAMGSLLLAILLWLMAMAFPEQNTPAHALLIGILLIYGLLISVINGMLYKILPFLAWLHLSLKVTEHKLSRRLIPNIRHIIPDGKARRQFWLHLAGLLMLAATAWRPTWFLLPMAAMLAISSTALWLNLYSALQLYKKTWGSIEAAAEAASHAAQQDAEKR
jgi:hypothetical protein